MDIILVEDRSLVADEYDISTEKWHKPLDVDGIYDPAVDLELWQFIKLSLNDQLDHLSHHVVSLLTEHKMFSVYKKISIPCSPHDMIVELTGALNPRRKISIHEEAMVQSGKYKACFNHDRYRSNKIRFYKSDDKRWRYCYLYSQQYRTTFVYALLQFLIDFAPDKFGKFSKALDYYSTAKAMVKKPRKFKST